MCLSYKKKEEDKKEWLAKQPEEITAYKVVCVHSANPEGKARLYPVYVQNPKGKPFKRSNLVREVKHKYSPKERRTYYKNPNNYEPPVPYMAYFHLYANKLDADIFTSYQGNYKVIECKVLKKFITDVGEQDGVVIVTRKFTIVGQDEYLDC